MGMYRRAWLYYDREECLKNAFSAYALHGEVNKQLEIAKEISVFDSYFMGDVLREACASGDHALVDAYLSTDADVNASSVFDETALHIAIHKKDTNIVRKLLAHPDIKADQTNREGDTPLHLAARVGSRECVDMLLRREDVKADAKCPYGYTALHWAVWHNNPHEIAERLLSHPAVRSNAPSKDGHTPLHCASRRASAEVCQLLLQHGADPSALCDDGTTPLHAATAHGKVEVVEMLLTRDDVEVDCVDAGGMTPFLLAVRKDYMEIVKLLSEKTIDLHAKSEDGNTALHFAVMSGNAEMISHLLSLYSECPLHRRNSEGLTPINLAARGSCHDKDCVKRLSCAC